MMNRLTHLFLMSAFGLALACAQGGGTPPSPADMIQRRVDMLTQHLSLTAAQQDQAKIIFTDAAAAESPLRDGMKTARQTLTDAVKSNNTAGIAAAATTIGSLTAQSTEIGAKADASVYQILTVDQRPGFSLYYPGPGGPGGPGGGFGRGGAPRNRPAPPND